jgi:hypothetical protein
VDLSQWLARVQQYSSRHPACAQLGAKTLGSFAKALDVDPVIVFSILQDGIMVGETHATHPAIRTRTAPHLHERGVLALRFMNGVTVEELTNLVEICTLPVQSIFDYGGMSRLANEREITHIQIDEIAHDVSAEEREAQRRRARMRAFLTDAERKLLARKRLDLALHGDQLRELLDHPDIALTLLEENLTGICVMFAGICIMVREEERRTGDALYPKLKVIFTRLSPAAHDRILLGCPSLTSEFRSALVWAFDGLDEAEFAAIALPGLRSHSSELEVFFYAFVIAAPHEGRRWSILRRLALKLYDLPGDDPASVELLALLARSSDEFDSFKNERDCMYTDAARIVGLKDAFIPAAAIPAGQRENPPAFESRRVMMELVTMASRTRHFAQLCGKLPVVATTYARAGSTDAVIGMIHGLNAASRPELRDLLLTTMRDVASAEVATQVLADLDTQSANLEGVELDELTSNVRLFVALRPDAVFDRLELSESRKMRRVLLEALSRGGPKLMPLVRARLESPQWFVVRNVVSIVPRLGGTAADLTLVSKHPNERVRIEVVRALRLLQPDETVMDIVVRYLTDSSQEVRQASRVMLRGDLLSLESIQSLATVANNENVPEELRRRVVDALGRSQRDAAAMALYTLIQPKGLLDASTLRDVAAAALRRSPAKIAPQYFEEGLNSNVWRVRKAFERAAASGGESS